MTHSNKAEQQKCPKKHDDGRCDIHRNCLYPDCENPESPFYIPPQPIGREEEKEGERTDEITDKLLAQLTPEMQQQINHAMSLEVQLAAKDKQIAELTDDRDDVIKEKWELVEEANKTITTLRAQLAEIAEKSWDAAMEWARYKQKVQLGIETVIPPDKSTYLSQFNQQK